MHISFYTIPIFGRTSKTLSPMSDFWLFFNNGLHYIFNWKTYDIILFLIVLCAAYNFSAWKKLLILITLFTLGHTISLLLGFYNVVTVSSRVVAFLIPITILFLALFNLFTAEKGKKVEKKRILYIVAAFFGLIHGLGFVPTFKELNPSGGFLPLLEFELGVEAGQIMAVIIILIITFVFQNIFRFNKRDWVLVVSSIVIGMLIPMFINNWIF